MRAIRPGHWGEDCAITTCSENTRFSRLFANGPIIFIQVQTVEKKRLENFLLSVNVIVPSVKCFPVLNVRTKKILWGILLCFHTLLYTSLITPAFCVPNRFSRIQDFLYLKLGFGIQEIQARLGIENITGGGMPKITIGITGLCKILGGDYGIEELLWHGWRFKNIMAYYVMFTSLTYPFKHETNHSGFLWVSPIEYVPGGHVGGVKQ